MGIGRSLTIVTYPSKVQVIPELDKNIIPYRGLEPFEKEQAEFFFGRNQVVENIWKVLDLSNFVAVIGPSGSGKSSVIRAGLAPWLEASGWQILKPMRPGISPLAKLTATFEPFFQDNHHQKQLDELIHINSKGLNQLAEQLPGSAKFLLVVDQFEEVFTLSRVEERERFIEILTQLSEAPYSRLAVVTTLRADFLEPCLQYPTLTQLIQTQAIFIPPLIGADLEQAISEPARKMGYVLESGLLGDILQDVSQEPGCLPLLQFTLLELWARRDHSTQRLLRLAYHDIDRLSGALDRFAEQFYEGLSKTKQTWVKRICLKLIRPSKEEKDIRQRTTKYKLLAMANEVRSQQELLEVLTELVNKRLLVIGKDNSEVWVDLAHEALMNEWKRFKNWRAQDRELRQLIDRLENALQEWQKNPTEDNLMMGGLLASVRDYWHVLEPELDTRMKNFSQSSFLHEQNRIAQLQESEEKFSKAFRFSAVAMALTTFEESIIIDVNDSFLKGSGYKREEVIGRTSPELNIWVDLALRDELKQTLERSGAVQNLEITFRRKSGELGVALLSADIITLKGKRCMLVGTIDITERKQAEKALQQSEARFRVIAENEACALLVYQNNQLCYVNLAAESITGYSREELLSMKAWELVHPDFREIAKQRALARQRGETVLSRYEIKILTKFGEERWVDYTAGLISFEGEPAVLATAYDITARKYSEEALRESEEKFSIAFHSSPAAMVISEFKDFYTAHYLDINDALLKIVGYQREELIGKPIIDLNLWVDISERTKMLSVLQESGSVRNFVMQFRQKSGEVGRALLSCEKINLKGKPCLLTMVIDVIDISSLDKKFL
jgi:PAS domain S-box-containing protein